MARPNYPDLLKHLVSLVIAGKSDALRADLGGTWFVSVYRAALHTSVAPITMRRAVAAHWERTDAVGCALGVPVHELDVCKSAGPGNWQALKAAVQVKRAEPPDTCGAVLRYAVEKLLAGAEPAALSLDLHSNLRLRAAACGRHPVAVANALRGGNMWAYLPDPEPAHHKRRVGRRLDLRKFLTWCTHTDGIDAQAVVTALLARPRVDAQPNPVGRPRTRDDAPASERDRYWAEVHEREQARDQGWGQ